MRETRSYGSVRGVRSNPYPYCDLHLPMPKAARLHQEDFEGKKPHPAPRQDCHAPAKPGTLGGQHRARIGGGIARAKRKVRATDRRGYPATFPLPDHRLVLAWVIEEVKEESIS